MGEGSIGTDPGRIRSGKAGNGHRMGWDWELVSTFYFIISNEEKRV